MVGMRVALALVGAVLLAGCASASYVTVKPVDSPGPCMTDVPARDLLLGVALSGGGSRVALFAQAGLEALARLRTADGDSVINKTNHLSTVSGGSISATYYMLKKPGNGSRNESGVSELIANPARSMVAGVGFEPTTFGFVSPFQTEPGANTPQTTPRK
jgi:hypothetical protein